MNMSARAYDRILKVARTIADLEACADVLDHHIMEAIAYRNLDRPSYLGSNLYFFYYLGRRCYIKEYNQLIYRFLYIILLVKNHLITVTDSYIKRTVPIFLSSNTR